MLEVAYFSPLPPAPTGIADYSQDLLPALSEQLRLTLFTEQPSRVDRALSQQFTILPIAAYPDRRWDFDLALYHMGNSGFYHAAIYEMARRYPGVVVLHEVVLQDFIAHITIGQGNYAAYAREIGYELGSAGYDLAWQMRLGRQEQAHQSIAYSRRLVDRSLGIIVHSRSAAARIRRSDLDRPVAIIDHLSASPTVPSLRQRLQLPDETILFASTGHVNPNKRLGQALDAFVHLRKVEPNVFFLIVGGAHASVDIPGLIRQKGLRGAVHWTDRVKSLEEFVGWTAAADVVVALRHPTLGEASGPAVRAMAAGKPLIVYDDGWYGELPGELCLQVPAMDNDALFQAMLQMVRQPSQRRAMGEVAAAYAAQQLDPRRIARRYRRFMMEVLNELPHSNGQKPAM